MTEKRPIEIELNPREQRFYDRLRQRVVRVRPAREPSAMRDMLLLLPDLTVLLLRLLRDNRVPISHKAIAVLGIGYVVSPVDLMPSLLLGPVGLVDDLLVVSAALSRVLNHVHPDVVRSHWSGQGDALDAVRRASSWSERQITLRVGRAWRRLFGSA